MIKRLLFLSKYFLLTVAFFLLGKGLFMLCCGKAPKQAGEAVVIWRNFLQVAEQGLTLDLSTALYCLVIPFLLLGAGIAAGERPILRRLLTIYNILLSLALSLAIITDTAIYPYWKFKLNAVVLQYLWQPAAIIESVTAPQFVITLLAVLAATLALFRTYQSLCHPFPRVRRAFLALWLIIIPGIIIGIRGGLETSTTNTGQVYFSQDQFLNHAAINPLFSFLSSFEKSANNMSRYHFMSDSEAETIADTLYAPLYAPSSLSRAPKDIIIILMEGAGEEAAAAMPALQRLKKEGISFDNCYANSWRTDRGVVCALSGYPSFPQSSLMKMPRVSRRLPSIARVLKEAGYTTRFVYGGDLNFTNMRSYLLSTGFEHLSGVDDFPSSERQHAKWGVNDGILFSRLIDSIAKGEYSGRTGQPRDSERSLTVILTLSSHEPWDVPSHKYSDKKLNAFAYLDSCLKEYITSLKEKGDWDNTLVALLPDHSINYGDITELHPSRNRIPMVLTGGVIKKPRRVAAICNQTDLAATLLSMIGCHIPSVRASLTSFRWSRDVLSPDYTRRFALHNYTDGFSVVDSTGFVHYDLNINKATACTSTDSARLIKIGKAVLQATANDITRLSEQK